VTAGCLCNEVDLEGLDRNWKLVSVLVVVDSFNAASAVSRAVFGSAAETLAYQRNLQRCSLGRLVCAPDGLAEAKRAIADGRHRDGQDAAVGVTQQIGS
jgi:hypothetical protein